MSDVIFKQPMIEETLPEAKKRFVFSDYLGPSIVFVIFIGLWYLLSDVILPPEKGSSFQHPTR